MKKFLKKLTAMVSCFAILLVAGVSLTACGKTDDPKTPADPPPPPPPPAGTITFTAISSMRQSTTFVGNYFSNLVTSASRESSDTPVYHPVETDSWTTNLLSSGYWVRVASLSDFESEITTIKIGGHEFGTEDINISITNNHFVQSKAWKIEEDKLYIAYPIVNMELFYGKGEIEINGVNETLEGAANASFKAFTDVFGNITASKSIVTKGETEDNVLNATITLKDGIQEIALKYDTADNVAENNISYYKTVVDGEVQYAVTKAQKTTYREIVFGFYPVEKERGVTDVHTRYADDLDKTVEVTVLVVGSKPYLYRANIFVTA